MIKKFIIFITHRILGTTLLLICLISSVSAEQSGWNSLGPEGGFLLSFAVSPSSPEVLYAGCDVYGGIYRSSDSGENWEFMGMVSELGEFLDIEVHPDSSDIVYTACSTGGVYKTNDGGLNWENVFNPKGLVYSVGIDPNSPNLIYAGLVVDTADDYALFKSTDRGATWSDSSFQGNPVIDIVFYPDSLNTLYIGTSYGVHRSTDAGTTWTFCGPPAPSATIHSLAVLDFNTIFAGTLAGDRDAGTLYKTIDSGKNWNVSYDLGTTVWSLAVDPKNKNIIYMAAGSNMFGREGIFKTTDSGDNWFPVNNGLTDKMVKKIIINPLSPNILYAAVDGLGGVFKSTDRAENWTQISTGMRHTIIQAMCCDASNTLYAAIGWGTYKTIPCIFKSKDQGNSWDTLTTVPCPFYMTGIWDIVAHPDSSDLIYIGGMSYYENTVEEPSKGLLYRSHNGGETWEKLWTPDSIWITCLTIDPVSGNIYAGTGGGDTTRIYKVYRSTDNGINWKETSGWTQKNTTILDIIIDPSSPNILYVGTGGIVYKSTDYGANWIIKEIIPCSYSLLIDPDSPNIIYAGSGGPYLDDGGIYKSINSGENWNKIGQLNCSITSIVGNFGTSEILYAGTAGKFHESPGSGVFRSTDHGTSWEPINTNLTSHFILSMLIDPNSPNTIYAGTMGRGVFKYTEETGIETTEREHTRITSYLLSNFPNPFNSYTVISYQIPKSGRVTLNIYDISGRFIHCIVDESKQAGYYTVRWNGKNYNGRTAPSGVYFYHLNVEDRFSQTNKLILLK